MPDNGNGAEKTPRVEVRMYNHGLGDCFLLTIHGKDKKKHLLIDFGLHGLQAGKRQLFEKVLADIKSHTRREDGRAVIDIVVGTHQHFDHLSGFYTIGANGKKFDDVDIKELWLAWTENENDKEAENFQLTQKQREQSLKIALSRLSAAGFDAGYTERFKYLLGFIYDFEGKGRSGGLGLVEEGLPLDNEDEEGLNSNEQALAFLKGKAMNGNVRYMTPPVQEEAGRDPGNKPIDIGIEGVRIYVLGPPRQHAEEYLGSMNPQKGEGFGEGGTHLFPEEEVFLDAMRLDAGIDQEALPGEKKDYPFSRNYKVQYNKWIKYIVAKRLGDVLKNQWISLARALISDVLEQSQGSVAFSSIDQLMHQLIGENSLRAPLNKGIEERLKTQLRQALRIVTQDLGQLFPIHKTPEPLAAPSIVLQFVALLLEQLPYVLSAEDKPQEMAAYQAKSGATFETMEAVTESQPAKQLRALIVDYLNFINGSDHPADSGPLQQLQEDAREESLAAIEATNREALRCLIKDIFTEPFRLLMESVHRDLLADLLEARDPDLIDYLSQAVDHELVGAEDTLDALAQSKDDRYEFIIDYLVKAYQNPNLKDYIRHSLLERSFSSYRVRKLLYEGWQSLSAPAKGESNTYKSWEVSKKDMANTLLRNLQESLNNSLEDGLSEHDVKNLLQYLGRERKEDTLASLSAMDRMILAYEGDTARQVNHDWLKMAENLALSFDNVRNNTSLVLAIELVEAGKVLLFPGDAQAGNWRSWEKVQYEWEEGDGEKRMVTAASLLEKTVFYKVGHHGSHNATLNKQGLNLMSNKLVAMIPVDQHVADKVGWEMPFAPLLEALIEKTNGKVAIADDQMNIQRLLEQLPEEQRTTAFKVKLEELRKAWKKGGEEFVQSETKLSFKYKVEQEDGSKKVQTVKRPIYFQYTIS